MKVCRVSSELSRSSIFLRVFYNLNILTLMCMISLHRNGYTGDKLSSRQILTRRDSIEIYVA